MTLAPLHWVVGSGGLLGSSVLRELGPDTFRFGRRFVWQDDTRVRDDLREAVAAFAARLSEQPGRRWAISWCAGAGVVATSESALAAEVATFSEFLQILGGERPLAAVAGFVLLASSAGGIYAGSTVIPLTESSEPVPTSAYGRAKLAQEKALQAWALTRAVPVSSLAARFSNLYGPGQRLDKPQGLISHLSRSLIHGAPAHIYVSLDTIRDYLFGEDAGRRAVAALRRLIDLAPAQSTQVVKIFASEHELSIATLIGVFRQITRRKLRVVAGLHSAAKWQPPRLQFRSQIWLRDSERSVEIVEGVSRVYRHQLELFAAGRLPPPPPIR